MTRVEMHKPTFHLVRRLHRDVYTCQAKPRGLWIEIKADRVYDERHEAVMNTPYQGKSEYSNDRAHLQDGDEQRGLVIQTGEVVDETTKSETDTSTRASGEGRSSA
jgi:hypothetical protein